ncbi:MAG: GNAT family N-acetyltransferase, partial [Acidaminobacteraceae bacterium]
LEDNKLVGIISIRHILNDFLYIHGGNIGYSVRKSERKKGYATEMLSIALGECLNMEMDRALLTCDKENIGSMKTIINNGGKLENELLEGDRVTQRYWIEVS